VATWIPPASFSTGEVLSAIDCNTFSGDALFLYQAPYGSFFNQVPAKIPNGTWTRVFMTNTNVDNYGITNVTNGNIVVPLAGIYTVEFRLAFASAGSGGAISACYQNNAVRIWGSSITDLSSDPGRQSSGCGLLRCHAGDHIGIRGYQNSGAALLTETGLFHTAIEMSFVGSL